MEMLDIKFDIFGAPDGFDLYDHKSEKKDFFMSYYVPDKEKIKMKITRCFDGDVTYAYLRYRLFSGNGRPGSFFGMAVTVKSQYCTDPQKMYRLFDVVFDDVIERNVLLRELPPEDRKHANAKFLITSFKSAKPEVERIKNIITNNIMNKFQQDFKSIDNSFSAENNNLCMKFNYGCGNEVILDGLRKCRYIYISPEYKVEAENKRIGDLKNEEIQKTSIWPGIEGRQINKTLQKVTQSEALTAPKDPIKKEKAIKEPDVLTFEDLIIKKKKKISLFDKIRRSLNR